MPKVAVVILNYNGRKMLEQFLPSVIEYTELSYEIVVADNGSTDDSCNFIKENYPQITLLKSPVNEGFSKGYNTALAQINASYYVLLNSDVEVSSNWIEPIINLMEQNPGIGACQPKIRAYHQKSAFEYAGAAGGFIDQYGYPFCRGRLFDTIENDHHQYDDNLEIFWATGACMFVKANLYHKLGGLDNDFFAHMEEIDLCWRIKNAGYKIYYCSESTVYHVGGGTLHKSNPRKTFLNFRNGLVLLYKNVENGKVFSTLFIRMLLDGIAAAKFLFSGNVKDFYAVFRAHIDFYKNIGLWKTKRRAISEHIVSYTKHGILQKSLVWHYFIKREKKFSQIKF
jgi:GT2 family glycosyltransferase